jgi:cellulose synthase operon protein C
MFRSSILKPLALSVSVLLLAACQSGEERAEEHFRNAVALMEAGDVARASVEFRNVFDHNGQHREARATFAAMLRSEGEVGESYSQYLRLVEQYPDDLDGRVALAEMALDFGNWDEARRHGPRAVALDPEAPGVAAIAASLAYLDALDAEDAPARRAALDSVMALLEEDPGNPVLLQFAVDGAVRDDAREEALAFLDRAMAASPRNRRLYDTRLMLLAQLERAPEIETLLLEMIGVFPEDEDLPASLLRFYIARGEMEAARGFLRARAETAETESVREEALMALVGLRIETDGPEAAMQELDRIVAELPEGQGHAFRILRAGLRFDLGDRAAALAELETLQQGGSSPGRRTGPGRAGAHPDRAGRRGGRAGARRAGVLGATRPDRRAEDARGLADRGRPGRPVAVSRLRTALDLAIPTMWRR